MRLACGEAVGFNSATHRNELAHGRRETAVPVKEQVAQCIEHARVVRVDHANSHLKPDHGPHLGVGSRQNRRGRRKLICRRGVCGDMARCRRGRIACGAGCAHSGAWGAKVRTGGSHGVAARTGDLATLQNVPTAQSTFMPRRASRPRGIHDGRREARVHCADQVSDGGRWQHERTFEPVRGDACHAGQDMQQICKGRAIRDLDDSGTAMPLDAEPTHGVGALRV